MSDPNTPDYEVTPHWADWFDWLGLVGTWAVVILLLLMLLEFRSWREPQPVAIAYPSGHPHVREEVVGCDNGFSSASTSQIVACSSGTSDALTSKTRDLREVTHICLAGAGTWTMVTWGAEASDPAPWRTPPPGYKECLK